MKSLEMREYAKERRIYKGFDGQETRLPNVAPTERA